MTTQIKSIGIELECGVHESGKEDIQEWVEEEGDSDALEIGGDGSVDVPDYDDNSAEIKYYTEDLEHFFDFLDMSFGYVQQNHTCGNHIHVRFKNPNEAVALFSYREAFNFFRREYIKAFGDSGKYYNRLRNRYCNGGEYNEDSAYNQISINGRCDARYRMINTNSFNIHGTIEFRILPYFDSSDEAKASIKKLLSIIDATYAHLMKSKNCHYREFRDIPCYHNSTERYVKQISEQPPQAIDVKETSKIPISISLSKPSIEPISIKPNKPYVFSDMVISFIGERAWADFITTKETD